MTTLLPINLKVVAGVVAIGAASLFAPEQASAAQWGISIGNYGGYGNYGYNTYRYNSFYNGPIYHAPSVHYDRIPHTVPHWTPGRGWHTHTHFHTVPHYVPGHFDHLHGDHIHKNPNYHHRHHHHD